MKQRANGRAVTALGHGNRVVPEPAEARALEPVPASPLASEGTPKHLAHVDGMRAFAALVVLLNHAYAQIWTEFYGQFPKGLMGGLTYFLALGHLAVSVFIVISGYCLMLPVVRGNGTLRGGSTRFFKKRARRILPPYFGALAFSLLLIWLLIGQPTQTLWDVAINFSLKDVVSHVLLLQNIFGTGRINYVFWSIATEWQIYFLFPALVWLWRRVDPRAIVLAALAFGFALTFLFGHTRLGRANPHYLGLFVLGMLTAHLVHAAPRHLARPHRPLLWQAIFAGPLLLAAVLISRWGWRLSIQRWPYLDIIVAIVTAAALVVAARQPRGLVHAFFSWRPLALIGTFSYSLYLIHAPLLQLFWQYLIQPYGLGDNSRFAVLLLAGGPLILGASYLFFRCFEQPFMQSPPRQLQPSATLVRQS